MGVRFLNWQNNPVDRESIGGEEHYVSLLKEVYEVSTPLMKKVFDSLTRIYIESDMNIGAYAQLYRYKPGATFGIKKADIDLNKNLGEGLSRKEQLCFGRNDVKNFDKNLPHYLSTDNPVVNNYLFYVVAHEFGHLIDWKNKLSVNGETWQSFSWIDEKNPLKSADFEGRTKFKFYEANDSILGKANYSDIYKNLYDSNFVSAYAGLDPDEDFAETFAHVNLFRILETGLQFIDPKSSLKIDISSRVNSKTLKGKVEFVESVIVREDLVFP